MAKEYWRVGNTGECIITDLTAATSDEVSKYYGGDLICESVSKKKLHLISAAPDMLEALQSLENDDKAIPEHTWKLVTNAIAKATNIT